MSAIVCARCLVDETLKELRAAGEAGTERVVLWLAARPLSATPVVTEIYVPEQEADFDFFRIPASGMKALMAHLRKHKLALAAQVHSHPKKAFHSRADDAWAIVRHEGALSIVVPNFAADIGANNFAANLAVFRLSRDDRWLKVEADEVERCLQLT